MSTADSAENSDESLFGMPFDRTWIAASCSSLAALNQKSQVEGMDWLVQLLSTKKNKGATSSFISSADGPIVPFICLSRMRSPPLGETGQTTGKS